MTDQDETMRLTKDQLNHLIALGMAQGKIDGYDLATSKLESLGMADAVEKLKEIREQAILNK